MRPTLAPARLAITRMTALETDPSTSGKITTTAETTAQMRVARCSPSVT
jgi:hypothetical protein